MSEGHGKVFFLRTHVMYISQFCFLSPTLKTAKNDKILEKPRVSGNAKIIQFIMMKIYLNNN
jgi:hypothetical protein